MFSDGEHFMKTIDRIMEIVVKTELSELDKMTVAASLEMSKILAIGAWTTKDKEAFERLFGTLVAENIAARGTAT